MANTQTSIIDNRDGNTLLASLQTVTESGRELCIASAFFGVPPCWDAKGVDCGQWEQEIDEQEIDERVAALYGL